MYRSPCARLMTSRSPKIMVRPNATSASATPMISASTTCGRTTTWRYPRSSSITAARAPRLRSELLALVRADGLRAGDLADGLEIVAVYLDDNHVDDRLVVALAHLLRALRRLPARVFHRPSQLLLDRAAGLLDRLLEQIEQAVGIGSEQIGIALELLLERGDELLVGRRIDVDRVACCTQESLARAAHGADILLRHRSSRSRERQLVGEDPVFFELREEAHGVVARRRGHDDVGTRGPDLADIRSEILGPERRVRASDVVTAETFDVVLKRGDGAAAHLIVRTDEEIALARDVLRQPRGQRVRLHEGVGVHAKDVRVALRARDRRRIGDRRDQNAVVALGDLADRERGSAVHGPGQKIDLVLLQQLFGLAHSDGRVGFLVLE